MYSEHYGFSDAPFQLTPDARFWFDSRTHKKAMSYLGYGLAQQEGFVVITGEIGAGKSTLAAHLLDRIDHSRLTAISIVSTQVEGDDMLRLVAQGLGLDPSGVPKSMLLETVERSLEDQLRAGKRAVVIVDEAQNLPTSALEELRMLSNFQIAGKALVQIVLLAQPEFRDRLGQPGLEQLRQRVIATHHIDAMEPDEIEAYVSHRLGLVGWTGNPGFDAGIFPALHQASGGIPRRLNQLLNRLLLHGAVEQRQTLTAADVSSVAQEDFTAPVPAPAPQARIETTAPVTVAEPQPAVAAPPVDIATAARIAVLEARVEAQEAALRRALALMIEWVEREPAPAPVAAAPEPGQPGDRRFGLV